MSANGQVTESEMDSLNIPKTRDQQSELTDKDQRPQERQRAIVLTHDTSVARRREYVERKRQEREEIERKKTEREQERIKKEKEKEEKKTKAAEEKIQKAKEKEEEVEEKNQQRVVVAEEKARRLQEEKDKRDKEKEEKKELLNIKNVKGFKGIKRKKDKASANTNSNSKRQAIAIGENNIPRPLSIVVDPLAVPDETVPFMDLIFAMVEKSNGEFKQRATATTVDTMKIR